MFLGDTVSVSRPVGLFVFALVASSMLASACTSTTNPPSAARSACLLPTHQTTVRELGTASQSRISRASHQSTCFYPAAPGATGPTAWAVTLDWGGRALANFNTLHNPKTTFMPGTSLSGAPLAPPIYTSVSIGGTTAYRLVFTPASGSAASGNPEQLSSLKGKYVISVLAMGLTHAQDQSLLHLVLNQL